MGEEASTEVRVSDTPETDAFLVDAAGRPVYGLIRAIGIMRRLERERNLALAIARKYYNGPELTNFPNVKV